MAGGQFGIRLFPVRRGKVERSGMCGAYNIVTWLLIALVTILTILEGCYLGYYYRMENRTQILYPLDRKIYDAIQAMLK